MIDLPSNSSGSERFDVPGVGAIDVPVHRMAADRWPSRIDFEAGGYTNKVLIEHEGKPAFPEIALVRIARDQGWKAAWIDTYHHRCWADMPEHSDAVRLPESQERLLASIRERAGRAGGCWDVIAWRDDEVAFIESKSTDRIHGNQRVWFAAAVAEGLPPDSFAIAEWRVSGKAAARPRSKDSVPRPRRSRRHPRTEELTKALPGPYQDKVKRLGLTLVSDNTLRRVAAGVDTYPSRAAPLIDRNLITGDATSLTEHGIRSIEMLDPLLPAGGYPPELLR